MTSIIGQIAIKRDQIRSLEAKIPALTLAEQQWRTQSKVECTQALKAKRQECLADKQYKRAKADQYKSELNSIQMQVSLLLNEIKTLEGQAAAQNSSMVNLSTQGISLEAEVIKAEGTVKAEEIKAQATAKAIEKDAEAAAQSKRTRNMIIIGVVVVVVIVVVVVVAKKVKKKKN